MYDTKYIDLKLGMYVLGYLVGFVFQNTNTEVPLLLLIYG